MFIRNQSIVVAINVQSTAPPTASFRGQPDKWFVVCTATIARIDEKGKIQKHVTLSMASSLAIQSGAVFISNLIMVSSLAIQPGVVFISILPCNSIRCS